MCEGYSLPLCVCVCVYTFTHVLIHLHHLYVVKSAKFNVLRFSDLHLLMLLSLSLFLSHSLVWHLPNWVLILCTLSLRMCARVAFTGFPLCVRHAETFFLHSQQFSFFFPLAFAELRKVVR